MMDRNDFDWHGPMPAVTTPFTTAGGVDHDALAANIDRLMGEGATGVLVGGCTGEFWALTHDERVALTAVAREALAARGTLIVATGAATAAETIVLTRAAERNGADVALVLPSYFIALTPDEIVAHYREVGAACGLPLMLYNIPGNAGNALTPDILDRLAELPTVVALKESSGDWNNFYASLLRVGDRLRVFCGPSSLFGVPAMLAGADGTIDCFPNMWRPGGRELCHAAKRGDLEAAHALQRTGQRLTKLFTSDGMSLYPATKAAMDLLGLPGGGRPRGPLQPLTKAQMAHLERGLADLGFGGSVPATAISA
ncbi:dihydrodipicolinate synthase family protein [Polymorphobacter multimanifer]|uniref:dihydrodipicolinate synthase family protein n=1 Tax=Polymorphobacter multimanifer TaxID=1070431 RepID=UPI001665046D|nr:dihydrodipicolinate synthase family protein [Polymorphobacter multimanifer]